MGEHPVLQHSSDRPYAHCGLSGFLWSLKQARNLITWQPFQISCAKDRVVTDAPTLPRLEIKECKWVRFLPFFFFFNDRAGCTLALRDPSWPAQHPPSKGGLRQRRQAFCSQLANRLLFTRCSAFQAKGEARRSLSTPGEITLYKYPGLSLDWFFCAESRAAKCSPSCHEWGGEVRLQS